MPINPKLATLARENPAEFRRVMAEAYKKTVIPHPGQQVVIDSKARFKIMNCGRRFGKTVIAAKLITTAARKPDQMVWWVAPTYRIVKRGYVEVLKQLPAGSLVKPAPPATNFDAGRPIVLELKNGTTMEFYSAERPEGMLGAAVDFVVMDEASRMKPSIWQETISPTLIDHLGQALMISTPKGRNWFYYEWLKGQDSDEVDYASWTFTTQDNPTLPPGEADRMAASMPRMEADQEIFAKFLAAGSSVFLLEPQALQKGTVKPSGMVMDVVPSGHVYLGIDLARTNDYTVLYGAKEDGENIYFERVPHVAWEEQRRRIRRAVSVLRRAGCSGVTLMVDEGNAGSVIVEDLQDAGYDTEGVNFTTQKAPMVRLLANDLERGRAKILADKEYGLTEFENYEMDVTAHGRYTYSAPEGQHDDAVSAKMLSHWGCINFGSASVQTLSLDEAPSREDIPSGDNDAWGEMEEFDGDSFDDLIDEDFDDPRAAADAVGLVTIDLLNPPSPTDLLLRDDLWGV